MRCNKWDKALRSGQWEPQEVVEKLPDFLKFIKKVQNLIMDDQETLASWDSEETTRQMEYALPGTFITKGF